MLVAGEKIAAVLARDITAEGGAEAAAADQVIDATGKYVMPGGIDVHTHMEMPFGGTFSADTFETGTRAAAWGGTTTIIDFAVQAQGHLAAGHAGQVARQGGRQLLDRLRLPHDRLRRGRRRR